MGVVDDVVVDVVFCGGGDWRLGRVLSGLAFG